MIGSPYISRIFYTTNFSNEFHEILRKSISFDFLKLRKSFLCPVRYIFGLLVFWSILLKLAVIFIYFYENAHFSIFPRKRTDKMQFFHG
jgi:hypothetical protein